MSQSRSLVAVVFAVMLSASIVVPQAKASPLDGFAGAAVGFALGAMVAGQRPAYGAPRYRRAVVYRNRPARPHYAAASPRRRSAPSASGIAVSTASDPFAASQGAKPIPVSGH